MGIPPVRESGDDSLDVDEVAPEAVAAPEEFLQLIGLEGSADRDHELDSPESFFCGPLSESGVFPTGGAILMARVLHEGEGEGADETLVDASAHLLLARNQIQNLVELDHGRLIDRFDEEEVEHIRHLWIRHLDLALEGSWTSLDFFLFLL